MKRYPKIVQMDARGQIVIPKDIRAELGLDEGTGFYMYSVSGEGILLKKIEAKELSDHKELIGELNANADKIGLKKENLDKAQRRYKKTKEGGLDIV
jgi:AbrB family looped-hinge helix DNA binding protein